MKQIVFLICISFYFVHGKNELKNFQKELIKQLCEFQDDDYVKDLCELENKVPEEYSLDYLKLLLNERYHKRWKRNVQIDESHLIDFVADMVDFFGNLSVTLIHNTQSKGNLNLFFVEYMFPSQNISIGKSISFMKNFKNKKAVPILCLDEERFLTMDSKSKDRIGKNSIFVVLDYIPKIEIVLSKVTIQLLI